MDANHYRQRLLDEERRVLARLERALDDSKAPVDDTVGDVGDESQIDEQKDLQLTSADNDSSHLGEVRDALARIEAGTFGLCLFDNEPISEKRLEAVPWAQYCVKHQEELERETGRKPATM